MDESSKETEHMSIFQLIHKVKFRKELVRYILCILIGLAIGVKGAQRYQYIGEVVEESPGLRSMQLATPTNENQVISLNSIQKPSGSSASVVAESSNVSPYDKIPNYRQIDYTYQSTFRSCLGNKCFNAEVDTGNGKTILRVGILGIKSSGANTLLSYLKLFTKQDFAKFDVVADTHVPPYGYGKNHGWSSIIRLNRNIVQHSYALVRSVIADESSTNRAGYMDIQTRQIVRWQCRLSHVAAHTRMLTVNVDDLINQPVVEIEKILSFIGYDVDRPAIVNAVDNFKSDLFKELQIDHLWSQSSGNKLINADSLFLNSIDDSMIRASVDAVANELAVSDTLKAWPCKAFKELSERQLSEERMKKLPMSTKDVAPDCSAKYVKCSVRYDFAESK